MIACGRCEILMFYGILFRSVFHFCVIILLMVTVFIPAHAFTWGPYRGMTAQIGISEQDVADFAKLGGNLLRIGFVKQPLMKKNPPYDFDEEAFAKLDQLLVWCEYYNIKVVIDPHTTPGTGKSTSTIADDLLWKDLRFHDLLDRLWDRIASHYRSRNNVIVGYDLLNEPAATRLPFGEGAADYNQLVRRLVKTIRQHDKDTPIIIEPPVGRTALGQWANRLEGINFLDAPQDQKIIYSPHMYEPIAFSHQGVKDRKNDVTYPGFIGVRYWDKESLRMALAPVLKWQRTYNVPIYIGEFSAARNSGPSGERYLSDLISIFEEYGWSWTYHAWREAPVWDAEIISIQQENRTRSANVPRLRLLREAFIRNK